MTAETMKARFIGAIQKIHEIIGSAFDPFCFIHDDVDPTFQDRAGGWSDECFGPLKASRRPVRTHRFLEEALELCQSLDMTESEARRVLSYVYGRAKGEPHQKVGGVMAKLAVLCIANGLDMHEEAERELARCWANIEKIKNKADAKPSFFDADAPAYEMTDRRRAWVLYRAAARLTTATFAERRGQGAKGRADRLLFDLSGMVADMRQDFATEIAAGDDARASLDAARKVA